MLIDQPATWIGALWNAFVGAAMPEEATKLLMLWLLLRRNKYFDERFDGIVYACCIGMGFAGTENVLYLFGNIENWQSVAVSRAIFAVPGHFMFAVAMGYFYSNVSSVLADYVQEGTIEPLEEGADGLVDQHGQKRRFGPQGDERAAAFHVLQRRLAAPRALRKDAQHVP